jgi:hypothetical protein
MRDTDLFRMALGIEPPWMVTKSDFDAGPNGWTSTWISPGAARSPARNAALPAVRPTTARKRPGGT